MDALVLKVTVPSVSDEIRRRTLPAAGLDFSRLQSEVCRMLGLADMSFTMLW